MGGGGTPAAGWSPSGDVRTGWTRGVEGVEERVYIPLVYGEMT